MIAFEDIQALVRHILENPCTREWSLQGLGMLRTYLTPKTRLHVWNDGFSTPKVSEVHTHPWDFKTLIVSGTMVNNRMWREAGTDYMSQPIKCGEGGGLVGEPYACTLKRKPPEIFHTGDSYSMVSAEIHSSSPAPGVVTLVTREFHADVDHAIVYWKANREWVSAEPRTAKPWEIRAICEIALQRWMS